MKTTAHKIIIPLLCFIMSLMLFSAACAAGEKDGIPSSYNGFESGKLPAIRNQGDHNSGWAFAAIAAVEADLIHDENADTDIDLSELHLAYFANHEFTDEKELNTGDTITISGDVSYLDAGENNDKAPLALFNMLGPVEESVVPYGSASDYSPDPADGRAGEYQITGFYYYSSFDGFTDNDWAKTAIMEHGAVIAAYYDDFQYYVPATQSYYCPQESETNHVITLVGWDDNRPRSLFKPQAPGDGAWLVRNSRGGGGYDYSGYFWLSYYDVNLSKIKYAFDAQPWRYAHVYSYDNCPGTGYFGTQSDKVSQSFHVDARERIQALGFYTPDPDLSLLFTLTSGDLSGTQSFTAAAAGYYLVTLSDPLDFPEGSDVTVEYTITNGGSMTVSYEQGPYDEGKGITYDSGTGSGGLVIYGVNTGYDGRIKLFTNDLLQQTTAVTIRDTDGHDIPGGSKTINTASYQLKAAAEPAEAAQRFAWTSSNTVIAVVNGNGKVTFHSAGTVTVTAAALDGSDRSASVTLTCDPPPATAVSIQDASGDVTGSTFTTNDAVYQLNAAAAPESALQTFTWTSSDETIAAVDPSGKVSFKKAGTVMITANHKFDSEYSASVTLTYVPLAAEVSIHDASGTDITGQTVTINITAYQLTAAAAPEGAAQNFTWTSSDETIAAVDPSGKVSFKKAGKVTITAAALDGSEKSAAIAMIYVTNETTLILPSELTDIRSSAFEGSTGFNAVILPDGVKTIGNRAFAGCSNLWLVYIPDSVSSIPDDAFSWNSDLNYVCESETGAGAIYARSHQIPYRIGY